jgi:hypothetical protein
MAAADASPSQEIARNKDAAKQKEIKTDTSKRSLTQSFLALLELQLLSVAWHTLGSHGLSPDRQC